MQEACEQVVHILIADEPELAEDLTKVEISPEKAAILDEIKVRLEEGEGEGGSACVCVCVCLSVLVCACVCLCLFV